MKADGSAQDRWLCPSNPDNLALETASMLEIARKYAVDGLGMGISRPGK